MLLKNQVKKWGNGREKSQTGKSYLIRECPKDAVFASYLIRVRVGALVDSGYLSHFFNSPNYWQQITQSARGVAQPGVNASTLKTLKIPLPPLLLSNFRKTAFDLPFSREDTPNPTDSLPP